MGDHHDRGPVIAAVGVQHRDDRFGGGRVEGQQRLVAQQPDRRVRIVLRADRRDDGVDLAGAGERQAAAVPVDTELDQVPGADGQVGIATRGTRGMSYQKCGFTSGPYKPSTA